MSDYKELAKTVLNEHKEVLLDVKDDEVEELLDAIERVLKRNVKPGLSRTEPFVGEGEPTGPLVLVDASVCMSAHVAVVSIRFVDPRATFIACGSVPFCCHCSTFHIAPVPRLDCSADVRLLHLDAAT